MSIATDNRKIALEALALFSSDVLDKEGAKNYANAVEKAMLLLGSQGLKRTILYITSQMGKKSAAEGDKKDFIDNSRAFSHIYQHLAKVLPDSPNVTGDRFQYWIIKECSKEKTALLEARAAFFLLCLKRLVKSQDNDTKNARSKEEKEKV